MRIIKGVNYYLRIYRILIGQVLKTKMQFSTDFLISIFAVLVNSCVGIVTFILIFHNTSSIKGWGFNELIFMYGYSLIASSPANIMLDNVYRLNGYVQNGEFIKFLFRPVDVLFYYFAETIDIRGVVQLIAGCIFIGYAYGKLDIHFSFFNCVLFLVLMINSMLLWGAIMIISSATAFITVYGLSFLSFITKITEYTKYPTSIFNKFFQFIFLFILPIGLLAYYPCSFFLGKNDSVLINVISCFSGIIAFFISYKVWSSGARRYTGTGS